MPFDGEQVVCVFVCVCVCMCAFSRLTYSVNVIGIYLIKYYGNLLIKKRFSHCRGVSVCVCAVCMFVVCMCVCVRACV